MDNATHTLFALTLARTPLGRAGRGTTAALVIASNAPDLDIVGAARGGISYLAWHRGPTHGPLGIVGLGVATAGLVWLGVKGKLPSSPGDTGSILKGLLIALVLVPGFLLWRKGRSAVILPCEARRESPDTVLTRTVAGSRGIEQKIEDEG